MKLGTNVGLGPGHTVLDGDVGPSPQRRTAPQFSAHVYCGQTAAWIKMKLGIDVGLVPAHIVLDGHSFPFPPKKRGHAPPFSTHVYCGQTVVHLNY